jgi:hypothetical protein
MLNNCKACARQFFCKKEKCKIIRWLNTKNYGEVKYVKNKS